MKDKIKKSIEASKKKRATTKAINFRVPNKIYDDFMNKVEESGLTKDKILLEMIKEWIV